MKTTAMAANSHISLGQDTVEVAAAGFGRAAFSSYRRTKSAGRKAAATKPSRAFEIPAVTGCGLCLDQVVVPAPDELTLGSGSCPRWRVRLRLDQVVADGEGD